ncbi:glycosyltransferase family 4 protein [Sphingomonas sp. NBWT7]|uniref:glycosyltransferase n=1 Tax=Sphingomonas sp. NBWT7 TaxID=2596913 RepID=UPI001624F7DC|nr:glycosyltransferase [Sphingomonas sp. NBWT7]QNE32441.1 glycosyltransferase family 4 protein [Sphingomonas sp. NBWT7]
MRVLVVHNRYLQAGGEDSVFANEVALLRSGGCTVETLEVSNEAIHGRVAQLSTAFRAVYNPIGRRLMADAIKSARPDIVHVHNFFPQLSPALFDACRDADMPAIWTLHNYRITCANGLLFRDGRPCEDCVGRSPLPAVLHRCYRGSAAGSAAVAAMIGYHRARGTWHHKVARFIALSGFARDLFARAGIPAERLAVKPNFVTDPRLELPLGVGVDRAGAVFVGRLSSEKGVATMIDAWCDLPHVPLTIVGDGPERASLQASAPGHVRFVGFQDRSSVMRIVAAARALIVPSIWYEPFGLVTAEAMALGTPVIAARIGALATIVRDGINGLHFTAGDAADLGQLVRKSFAAPDLLPRLGAGARATWKSSMSPDQNLALLLSIYREAIASRGSQDGDRDV